jgi:hypothetical protein
MFVAMIIWNIWHPGRYLQGDDCDFPKKVKLSRKEKKAMKQEVKDSKRRGRRRSSSRKGARVSEYQPTTSFDEGALESQSYPLRGHR